MPQSKKRKKKQYVMGAVTQPTLPEPIQRRQPVSRSTDGMRQLVIGAIVALGCWGIAYTLALQSSPNRYVFAGMMAMVALLWSISFGVRLIKWQRRRQTN